MPTPNKNTDKSKYSPTLLVFKQYMFMLNFILEQMALY